MPVTIERLKIPSFDLVCCDDSFADTKKQGSYILIPGGGGGTRSGVKNQIQIAATSLEPEKHGYNLQYLASCFTDAENEKSGKLCSGVNYGSLHVSTMSIL